MTQGTPQAYVDTQTAVYEAHQQSWRWLGVFVDCKAYGDDESRDDGGNDAVNNEYCQRYLLWAAYVDPEYEGFGVNEYQYFQKGRWNKAACMGDSPCRRLDCHTIGTSSQLLGIFKEPYYSSEWFEQLFKHSGFCLWDSDTYQFMQNKYAMWPEQCTPSGVSVDEDGSTQYLYMDLKPGPSVELGLYTDSICKTEYTGDETTVSDIALSLGFIYPSATLQIFQKAMEDYKSCQPCRTMNLENPEQFACYDDADYTNVNQCMKFRTHTTMEAATWTDLQAAAMQGALTNIKIADRTYLKQDHTMVWEGMGALAASLLTIVSAFRYSRWKSRKRGNNGLSTPLVQK